MKSALAVMMLVSALCAGCSSGLQRSPMVQVASGIYEGCKPIGQADFDILKQKGIKTILSVETVPWNVIPERRRARQNGILFTNVPIIASPLQPSEKRVQQALRALTEPSLRPVFMHCHLGHDRTTFLIGLYRMYYEGLPPEAAWNEMLRAKFHSHPRLRGFTTYFWSHTNRPAWVASSP
jgi:protein tyrosine phosphatase (PTP) superfamily phosphohydrolase (DUF442 family)